MVSPYPERSYIKHAPEVPEDFIVPDLISKHYDIQSIASALDADALYNDRTGDWTLTLYRKSPEGKFRPVLTLSPNPEAKPGHPILPGLVYSPGEDEEPVSVRKITSIMEDPKNDAVEFQSFRGNSLTRFVLRPKGTFGLQKFSTGAL